MSFRPRLRYTPEALAQLRKRLVETHEPKRLIAQDFGICTKTLDRLARRERWPMRRDYAHCDLPSDLKPEFEAENAMRADASGAADAPALSIADRLERAIDKELAAVELMRATLGREAASQVDAERTARTLARLTETLSKVRRLRLSDAAPQDEAAASDLPEDIDGFRHALARRIEAFVRSWTDRGIPSHGQSGKPDPSQ